MHARRCLHAANAAAVTPSQGRRLVLITLVAVASLPVAGRGQPAVSRPPMLALDPVKTEKPPQDRPDLVVTSQRARFLHGPVPYTLSYHARTDPKKPQEVLWAEGYLGMPGPTSCNWYGGGFLFLSLNGKDVGRTPVHSVRAVETTGRGILDLVWRHELADVRVRLLGLQDQPCLLCEVAIERRPGMRSAELDLRCYPSFFTAWHKRTGARRVQTPSLVVSEGETRELPVAENWWALYYDEVFDVAKGEGEGPCVMLVLPDDVARLTYAPGGYVVSTRLTCAPETQRVRLAFWDFKGQTNADALARLRRDAPTVRELLTATDFTPTAVASFDPAAARQELQEALASQPVRALLGEQARAGQEWVDRTANLPAAGSITGQEELFAAAEQLNAVIWHVRLARLIADQP